MLSTLFISKKDENGQYSRLVRTDEINVGINILETADTNGNTLNFIWKSANDDKPLDPNSIVSIKLTGEVESKSFIVISDQVDDLNTSQNLNKVYVHNVSCVDPLSFLNTIPCESITHSFFTDEELLTVAFTEQKTYLEVLEEWLVKMRIDKIVKLSSNLSSILIDITAPELSMKNLTAREIIEQLLGTLGLIPILDANNFAQIADLDVLPIYETTHNIETITREETNSSSTYLTSNRNVIVKGRNDKVLNYPSIDGFIGVFSNTKTFTEKDTSNFLLPHNISNLIRVIAQDPFVTGETITKKEHTGTIKTNKETGLLEYTDTVTTVDTFQLGVSGKSLDVTDFIITKEEYDTLTVNNRDNKLYYEIGDNKIQGWNVDEDGTFGLGESSFEEMLSSARSKGSIPELTSQSFKQFDGDGNAIYNATWTTYHYSIPPSTLKIEDVLLNVVYKAETKAETITHKSSFDNGQIKVEKFNSQSQTYLNLKELGSNQRDLLNIAGKSVKSITQKVTDVNDIVPLTADLNGLGNVIKRNITVHKNHLIVKYDLLDDFKVIPNYAAVNNEPRIFLNDVNQSVERNFIIDNYIVIEKLDGTYTSKDEILSDFDLDTINSTLKYNIVVEIKEDDIVVDTIIYANLLPDKLKVSTCKISELSTNSLSLIGVEPFSLNTTFGWQHNIDTVRVLLGSAKDVSILLENKFETLPAQYTNDFGRIEQLVYELYNDMNGNNTQYHAIPNAKASGDVVGLNFINSVQYTVLDINKDALEKLNITNQFSFVTIDKEVKIYPALARTNRLLSGVAQPTKVIKLVNSAKGDERTVSGDIENTINLVYNRGEKDYKFDVGENGAGHYAIVIVGTNEPLIAFNNLVDSEVFNFKLITKKENPFIKKSPWL